MLKYFTAILLFVSLPSLANKVSIHCNTSPMGKFTLEGTELSGSVFQDGDKYLGKNLRLDLRSLQSGNKLRDEHVQDYFETKKYSHATLIKGIGRDSKFAAELSIHGVTKKVSGTYAIDKGVGTAEFLTKLSDFNIKPAMYLGVGVEDEVRVTVTMPISTKPNMPKKTKPARPVKK